MIAKYMKYIRRFAALLFISLSIVSCAISDIEGSNQNEPFERNRGVITEEGGIGGTGNKDSCTEEEIEIDECIKE